MDKRTCNLLDLEESDEFNHVETVDSSRFGNEFTVLYNDDSYGVGFDLAHECYFIKDNPNETVHDKSDYLKTSDNPQDILNYFN